jgi:hypothetical protein
MYNSKHYVPLLKWHRGEGRGVRELTPAIKAEITPIIEIEASRTDLVTGAALRTPQEQIEIGIARVSTDWNAGIIFLDAVHFENATVNGAEATHFAYEKATNSNISFIPVVRVDSKNENIIAANAFSANGAAIRLMSEDFEPTPIDVQAKVQKIAAALAVDDSAIDLIVDLESVAGQSQLAIRSTIIACLNALPAVTNWRTITFLLSAFPQTVSSVVPASSIDFADRSEWQAWQVLYMTNFGPTAQPNLERMPSFGDYGIQSPIEFFDFDPRYMKTSAQVRYALEAQWYLARGLAIQLHGGAQYGDLAAALIASNYFMGADHCWGCKTISDCADGLPGANSPERWRSIGTCHHLTLTAEQIRMLP